MKFITVATDRDKQPRVVKTVMNIWVSKTRGIYTYMYMCVCVRKREKI